MQEENDSIIELVDEAGETVAFEHLATLEHEGEYYIVLSEVTEDEEPDAEVDVVIMKIEPDENGQDTYICVEDEALQEELFEQFLDLMDENNDIE